MLEPSISGHVCVSAWYTVPRGGLSLGGWGLKFGDDRPPQLNCSPGGLSLAGDGIYVINPLGWDEEGEYRHHRRKM